ncbi:hypothetical protein ACA910_016988 [Epithemia clementina (nom. ined.)]
MGGITNAAIRLFSPRKRFPFFAAAIIHLIVLWNKEAEAHIPEDSSTIFPLSSSSLNPHPSKVDYAVFQSFTFQTFDDDIDAKEGSSSSITREELQEHDLLSHPSNRRDLQHSSAPTSCSRDDVHGCCVVSTNTVYNAGMVGYREWEPNHDSLMALWKDQIAKTKDDEDKYENDDEDDDDDDNDGSCSILSNASVNRSRKKSGLHVDVLNKQKQRLSEARRKESHIPRCCRAFGYSKTKCWWSPFIRKNEVDKRVLVKCTKAYLNKSLTIRGGATSNNNLGVEVARKLFVSAVVTLVFEWMFGHILEFVKIDMQTSSADKYTYFDSIKSITSEKGIGGLWDGFIPWGFIQAVFKGAVFGLAHAVSTRTLTPLADKGVIPLKLAMCVAGGIAGGVQGYVLSPTLLLKTRVMTDPIFREKMTMFQTIYLSATIGYNVVKNEGSASLMKGSSVFATKRVLDWATRYLFADFFESLFLSFLPEGQKLNLLQKSCASFLGGVFSTSVTLPLDVLVSKIQDAKKAGEKVSAVGLFRQELKLKGWKGVQRTYMRGFEARLLHVCFTVVVMKTFAPVLFSALFE